MTINLCFKDVRMKNAASETRTCRSGKAERHTEKTSVVSGVFGIALLFVTLQPLTCRLQQIIPIPSIKELNYT